MVLLGARRVVARQVADEAANGRQSAVARRPGIAPTRLQVGEERRDAVDVEIRRAELGHGRFVVSATKRKSRPSASR